MDRRTFALWLPAALATLLVSHGALARGSGGGGGGGGGGKGGGGKGGGKGGKGKGKGATGKGGGPEDSPLNVEQIVKAPSDDKQKYVTIRWGKDSTVKMSIKSGAVATFIIKIKGLSTIHGSKLVERPSNGEATAGGYRWTYRSRPGFTGQDTFEVEADGSGGNSSGVSRIAVKLSVEP